MCFKPREIFFHLVIKSFGIQLTKSFTIVNIDYVACDKFNNVLVYDIIRDKLFKTNMLSSILFK